MYKYFRLAGLKKAKVMLAPAALLLAMIGTSSVASANYGNYNDNRGNMNGRSYMNDRGKMNGRRYMSGRGYMNRRGYMNGRRYMSDRDRDGMRGNRSYGNRSYGNRSYDWNYGRM